MVLTTGNGFDVVFMELDLEKITLQRCRDYRRWKRVFSYLVSPALQLEMVSLSPAGPY
jgi:hypothetical protein